MKNQEEHAEYVNINENSGTVPVNLGLLPVVDTVIETE